MTNIGYDIFMMTRVKKLKPERSVAKSGRKKVALVAGGVLIAGIAGVGGYLARNKQDLDSPKSYEDFTPVYSISKLNHETTKSNLARLKTRLDNYTPLSDYDSKTMPDWKDTNNSGCNSRYDELAESMLDEVRDGCKILSGTMFDYYTGNIIEYDDKISGGGVDVDHIVAKGDAWRSGGYSWGTDRWIEFANDPDVLISVSASINRQKGDKDAARWLPPNEDFRCKYVVSQVEIKYKYALSVTMSEKSVMSDILDDKCIVK